LVPAGFWAEAGTGLVSVGGPVGDVGLASAGGRGCRPCFGWRPACGGWPVNSWWGPGWGGLGYGWGWPGCGYGGWYGATRYSGVESVFLSVPFGGGASFFSGSVVPYPVPVWAPYAVPVPFWLGAAPARSPRARFAASAPPSVRSLPAEPTRALGRACPDPPRLRSARRDSRWTRPPPATARRSPPRRARRAPVPRRSSPRRAPPAAR